MPKHMLAPARAEALRLVGLQVVVVVAISLLFLFFQGVRAGSSAFLGGLAGVLPSLYFARKLFSLARVRTAQKIIKDFYIGELAKLALSVGLCVLMLTLLKPDVFPFFIGFMGALMGFWLAPLMMWKEYGKSSNRK